MGSTPRPPCRPSTSSFPSTASGSGPTERKESPMAKKIPTDAFDFYFSLGPARSYQAVADKYQVSKRGVVGVAKREDWQRRLSEVEAMAREAGDKKKAEGLATSKTNHLQALRLVLVTAHEGLRHMQMTEHVDEGGTSA